MVAVKTIPEDIAQEYTTLLSKSGEEALYKRAVGAGIVRAAKIANIEVEVLDLAESFFSLYRRKGDEVYFKVGKVLRRAAHTLYRQFIKMDNKKRINKRFLNKVK